MDKIQKIITVTLSMLLSLAVWAGPYPVIPTAGISGFTQGSILFASPIGEGAEDNVNLFFDDTLNYLGLGTNTPSHTLDVVGGAQISGSINLPSLTASEPLKLDGSNNVVTGDIVLSSDVTGVLPVGNGGTGVNASAASSGQLLIGQGSGFSLSTLTGTANQVTVTNGAGSITLATPQNIHTAASPTFAGIDVGNLNVTTNTLSSSNLNGDIILSPNGTGGVTIPALTIDSLLFVGASGRISEDLNLTFDGSVLSTPDLQVGNIGINGNTIRSTNVNGNIILNPDGTGSVNLPDLTVSKPLQLDASGNVISADIDISTMVTGSLSASSVSNVAAGGIVATDVQAAINELDTEKVAKAGDTMTGALGIGGAASAVAQLDLQSTTKGFLKPRMTTAERDLIAAVEGLEIYNLTTKQMQYYDGSIWISY